MKFEEKENLALKKRNFSVDGGLVVMLYSLMLMMPQSLIVSMPEG